MAKKRKLDPPSTAAPVTVAEPDAPADANDSPPASPDANDAPPASSDSNNPPPTLPDASDPPPDAVPDADEPEPSPEPQNPPSDPVTAPAPVTSEPNGTSEPLRDLLEPLSKEQIIALLLSAASRHPDIPEEVESIAGNDPAHRKIFVHGLGWDTTTESLAAIFSPFGEIEDCNAVKDKISGKSKGYGFVLFKHRSSARKALVEPQKKIGNRVASCQLASLGPVPAAPSAAPAHVPGPPTSEYTQRKIYVSNVSADIDPQKLVQFFAKFGEIEEGPLGLDRQTGKPKGFCLFVYKAVESARKALEEPHKNFEGHMLHCQKAIDGPKAMKAGWSAQAGGWGGQQQSAVSYGSGSYSSGNYGKSAGFGGAVAGRGVSSGMGHLMAPSQAGVGYGQSVQPQPAAAGINPALGQALTALLSSSNAGVGLTNLLGTLAASGSQAVPPQMGNTGGYGSQAAGVGGGYGGAAYGTGRGQPGGHYGGGPPYMGR